jgi:hypothetical protein
MSALIRRRTYSKVSPFFVVVVRELDCLFIGAVVNIVLDKKGQTGQKGHVISRGNA